MKAASLVLPHLHSETRCATSFTDHSTPLSPAASNSARSSWRTLRGPCTLTHFRPCKGPAGSLTHVPAACWWSLQLARLLQSLCHSVPDCLFFLFFLMPCVNDGAETQSSLKCTNLHASAASEGFLSLETERSICQSHASSSRERFFRPVFLP